MTEKDIQNLYILQLSGVLEYYNNKEIIYNSNSEMTRTVEFIDGAKYDMIIRYRRKDG